jgi:hypothetical protein
VAFSVLFTSSDEEDIQKIINLIHTEQMNYMQTYMVSYVEDSHVFNNLKYNVISYN